MATLTIRKLDDAVYARLKAQAEINHRSVEAEARFQLGERTPNGQAIVAKFRATMLPVDPDYEGSVALIRAVRDEA